MALPSTQRTPVSAVFFAFLMPSLQPVIGAQAAHNPQAARTSASQVKHPDPGNFPMGTSGQLSDSGTLVEAARI